MNISFEISPLITASGSYGDKSGVYRYMYGFLSALIEKVKSSDNDDTITLFTFSPDLFTSSLNPDIAKLIDNKKVLILGYTDEYSLPKQNESSIKDFFSIPLIKEPLRLFNNIFKIRTIYDKIRNKYKFLKYIAELTREFKKLNITTVIHSETGFYHLQDFKNIITIYDMTTIIIPNLHREATCDLQSRKLDFAKQFCDGLIVISKSTKKDLKKYSEKFEAKKMVVAYPGMNKQLLSRSKGINEINTLLKSHHNKLEKNEYLLYYGTFEPRKNIMSIVRAFSELYFANQIPKDMKLVLIGGRGWGKVKEEVLRFIHEAAPSVDKSPFIVLDFLSDEYLASFIRNAYALLYPSLYEGFGLPVLEAMTLGTPVITSDSSSLPEVGGDAVLYVKPKNYINIKNKIEYLVHHPEVAKNLHLEGLKQSKKFSWKNSAKAVYNFIEEL